MQSFDENVPFDEERLRAADPDGLYLFMLEPYPYMMTPDQVAKFTGATGQEIRKLLSKGEMQGCKIGVRWLIPKLGLLNYLYKHKRSVDGVRVDDRMEKSGCYAAVAL